MTQLERKDAEIKILRDASTKCFWHLNSFMDDYKPEQRSEFGKIYTAMRCLLVENDIIMIGE